METSLPNSDEVTQLVQQAVGGNALALTALMDQYRDRLKRMVGLRMDRRLQGRIDASDVVQEALIDAARRLEEYARQPPTGFYLWLRWLAADRLLNAHRYHLGTLKRDAAREVSLYRRAMPEACSVSLAAQLLGKLTSPTQAIAKAELQLIVQEVLNSMDEMDREILVLRNFEQLSTTETAEVLGINRSTASKRYLSALKRLKQALSAVPGFKDQFE
jgi:RNA polymerase sigma-70 factor (ECF subfamily)